MSDMLINSIVKAQNGDKVAMESLLSQFNPLITKYSKKLVFENAYDKDDAVGDLQLYFIQSIRTWKLRDDIEERKLVSYICKFMETSYLNLSMRQNKYQRNTDSFCALADSPEGTQARIDESIFTIDQYPELEYEFIKSLLTPYEASIVFFNVIWGYPCKDIARHFKVSAPAISQAKTNAIHKLRNYYCNMNRGDQNRKAN